MMLPTHTHELNFYGITIFVLFACGSFQLSNLIYERWCASYNFKLLTIDLYIKIFIVAWGFVFIPLHTVAAFSLTSITFSSILGLAAGWVLIKLEKLFAYNITLSQKNNDAPYDNLNKKYFYDSFFINEFSFVRYHFAMPNHTGNMIKIPRKYLFSLTDIILIAVFEELIFRGFMVSLCFMLPNNLLITLVLACTTLIFGFGHLSGSLRQFITKTLLGFIALLITLISHSVLSAIIAHVYLNMMAYRESILWANRNANKVLHGN